MSNVRQLDHHEEYYIKSGDLYIIVSHTLFRVHSFFFQRESQRFRDLMAAPVPGATGQLRRGEADNVAIIIKDVSVEHFAKFLWVFYNPVYGVYHATLAEWTAILKLAHEYKFPEIKRLAIRELENSDISLAERIALYQNYSVEPVHLVPLYVKFCMRDEGPTDEETSILGIKTSLIIFRARERLRFRPLPGGGDRSSPDENDITRTIYSLLGFDYNGQIGSVPRRRETRDVARRRERPEAIFGDQAPVVPESDSESNFGDAEENLIVTEKNCGHMEIGQKELTVVCRGQGRIDYYIRMLFQLVPLHTDGTGAVAIFIIVPACTFLFLYALSWTFRVFKLSFWY